MPLNSQVPAGVQPGATGSLGVADRIVATDRMQYAADLLPALAGMVPMPASERCGVPRLDPVVALPVGAARIGARSWDAPMDRRADPAAMARISKIVDANPGVRGHQDLRARVAGTRMSAKVRIVLDGGRSPREARSIVAEPRRKPLAALPDADVTLYDDPV